MTAVKITVLKRSFYADLAKAHSANSEMRPCELFADGQVFIAGMQCPDGFCSWAWADIFRLVAALNTGGTFDRGSFKGWMKDPGTAMVCCTDGYRPVTFMLERIDTKDVIDRSKVKDPAPAEVYDSERWGEFSYEFPALGADAHCAVRLHFCEVYHGAAGKRRFGVALNGRMVLEEFDIFAEAGGKCRAIVREFEAAAGKDGKIRLDFKKGSADFPKLSGVEIVAEGKAAYAVNSGGGDYGAFKADAHFCGGNATGD